MSKAYRRAEALPAIDHGSARFVTLLTDRLGSLRLTLVKLLGLSGASPYHFRLVICFNLATLEAIVFLRSPVHTNENSSSLWRQ